MVKLASAREMRMYGPRNGRNRAEYMNAGVYLFGTVVLLCGLVATGFSKEPRSGLILLAIAFALIAAVNLHDLVAHLAGIDHRFGLMWFDAQLALVEFAVPLIQALGALFCCLAVLFIFVQEEKGYDNLTLGKHAVRMLIAGQALWVVASIHNSCQIYERADAHIQILQQSVHIPFLMGSLLLLVGAIINIREQAGLVRHGHELLGRSWVRMGIFGSLILFVGGLTNVVKVFKMHQMNGLRLEKLRGGAHDRLMQEREGQIPLIQEVEQRRRRIAQETQTQPPIIPVPVPSVPSVQVPTPYRDVLLGHTS